MASYRLCSTFNEDAGVLVLVCHIRWSSQSLISTWHAALLQHQLLFQVQICRRKAGLQRYMSGDDFSDSS